MESIITLEFKCVICAIVISLEFWVLRGEKDEKPKKELNQISLPALVPYHFFYNYPDL